MFTITVNGKTYKVEKVTPRALYEMQPALDMFDRINRVTQASLKGEAVDTEETGPDSIKQAMDALLDWFVILCGNKFTKDDLLDGYPADSIMRDIGLALRAVQMQVTEALKAFPTTARLPKKPTPEPAKKPGTAASLWAYMQAAWRGESHLK